VDGGPAAGTEILIPIGEFVIGHENGTGFSFAGDPNLSLQHAKITRYPTGPMLLEDLGSAGGTLLNGVRIIGPKQVNQGDVIVVGSTTLVVDSALSREPDFPHDPSGASATPLSQPSPCMGALPQPRTPKNESSSIANASFSDEV
jgi:pSer/pThr/pTyr-binding forkhead associated (FHA) protein